ncbi:hypothetical protein GALL_508260 [mine drainage metagenome]|uniref:Uncharacterized protein n=1 Tax=mine drainage metagenome TaxID=410659 RepID=A0A1J5PQN5_9ZZZZ
MPAEIGHLAAVGPVDARGLHGLQPQLALAQLAQHPGGVLSQELGDGLRAGGARGEHVHAAFIHPQRQGAARHAVQRPVETVHPVVVVLNRRGAKTGGGRVVRCGVRPRAPRWRLRHALGGLRRRGYRRCGCRGMIERQLGVRPVEQAELRLRSGRGRGRRRLRRGHARRPPDRGGAFRPRSRSRLRSSIRPACARPGKPACRWTRRPHRGA